MRLVLASRSPRRAELLRAAGFAFETIDPDVDEAVRDGEPPAAYVKRLAEEKAAAVWAVATPADHTIIIAADTAVVIDDSILGKPVDDHDAASMLRRLSGRRHNVLTGVCVHTHDRVTSFVEATAVEFDPMSDADIRWYVESGEGRDKAGGYAIQGLASRFIRQIDGSYGAVVGLPVAQVYRLIKQIAGKDGRPELASP